MSTTNQTELAQAIYLLNKQAKKLRDEREALKIQIFDCEFEDQNGAIHSTIQHALDNWAEGCDAPLDAEGEFIDTVDEDTVVDSYCSSCCLCDYCQEEVDRLQTIAKELHEKLKELAHEIDHIYNLKDKAVKKLLKLKLARIIGYHEFVDDYRDCVEFNGFTYHLNHAESDVNLGSIKNIISSDVKIDTDLTFDKSKKIVLDFLR